MTYTSKQLTQLDNPYHDLGNADLLAEHKEALNELSLDEMRVLATRMISQCPKNELDDLTHAIRSYKPSEDKPAFHDVMDEALGIKKRILSLTDEDNKNPQNMILDDELSVEHLQTFSTLTENLLKDNEVAIAVRLVLKTETHSLSTLAFKINTLFPDSILPSQVQSACSVRREINRLLLGSDPLTFFTSEEFNQQRCFDFRELFQLIDKKEAAIATQCVLNATDNREQISRAVNQFFANSLLEKEIQHAFSFNEQLKTMLSADSPAQFFINIDIDQCNKFAALLEHQLSGHEQQIGKQLATLDAETRSKISRTLEIISTAAHSQNLCVRRIAQAMQCAVESSPQSGPGDNRSCFFSAQQPTKATTDNKAITSDCCCM